MGTVGTNLMTLADHAKTFDPNHKVARIIEMLSQRNGIVDDTMFMEGNLTTGHRTSLRNGLPPVYWKNYNQGVQVGKSTKITVDEKTGMMEAWSEVDEDLANLSGQVNDFRLSEARAFIQAMSNEMASTMLYGNSAADPEQFDGLTLRYSDKSAPNGRNIINGGGTTASAQTSIWLVAHGPDTFHGIYPKGSQVGLVHNNKGLTTIQSEDAGLGTKRMSVYQDQFKWHAGIALRDWRYVVRICNVEIGTNPDIPEAMIKAMHSLEDTQTGKMAFYMNRACELALDLNRYGKVGEAGMTYKEVDGVWRPVFRGVPIKTTDALLNTEEVVTGF